MNGDHKLNVYDQKRQNFIQHFSQIVKVLTEDDLGHPDTGDAIARLKEVRDLRLEGVKFWSLCGIQLWFWGTFDRCGDRLSSELTPGQLWRGLCLDKYTTSSAHQFHLVDLVPTLSKLLCMGVGP